MSNGPQWKCPFKQNKISKPYILHLKFHTSMWFGFVQVRCQIETCLREFQQILQYDAKDVQPFLYQTGELFGHKVVLFAATPTLPRSTQADQREASRLTLPLCGCSIQHADHTACWCNECIYPVASFLPNRNSTCHNVINIINSLVLKHF